MKKMIRSMVTVIFVMMSVIFGTGTMVPVHAATTAAGSSTTVTSGKTYYIVSKGNANLALDVPGARTTSGTRIWLYEYNSTAAQQFRFQQNNDGTYTIINPRSNKALDIKGGSKANGGILQLYRSNGTNAQKWQIQTNSDGTVTFINKGSGKALDVPGASFRAKKYLQQYTSNGTAAQRFYLVDASTANGYLDTSELLTLLNQYRASYGLTTLRRDPELEKIAKMRAKECVQVMDFVHSRPDGTLYLTAYPEKYRICNGETIASGYQTASEVLEYWKSFQYMDSVLTGYEYRVVGIAAYRYNGTIYWVQSFSG